LPRKNALTLLTQLVLLKEYAKTANDKGREVFC